MPYYRHDGLDFHFRETGSGIPFIFQHGLGGDVNQPFGLFQPPPGFRMLALDCRAHGETRPLGEANKINLASFADDLLAFMQQLAVSKAVVGGISMGAAVALNFVTRFPDYVLGLVLARPAWLDHPSSHNVAIYGQIAQLIREHGAAPARDLFRQSAEYQRIKEESSDSAVSLDGQFLHPRAEETVIKLERIPTDAPVSSLALLQTITVPTLVLANRHDPIHPFMYGEILARAIPGAAFRELTAKSVDREQHVRDVQTYLTAFLVTHWGSYLNRI